MAKTLDEAGVKRLIQEIKGANKNLNTPIPISTENTTESMAQNVKNIADYVEKAKAAGIANVNGMAVTCLIDGENSGVGYLYVTNTQVLICGILPYEDSSVSCITVIDGTYGEQSIVVEGHLGQVTSDMLVEGARNPIILTPDTTEVDEETYQKLLSDDVDVMFTTNDALPNLSILTYKYDDGDAWSFTFSCFSREGVSLSETYLYGYEVRITKTGNPHQCEVINNSGESQFDSILLNEGFIRRTTLSPVLQEIDLSGTDADRKAKLDQFAADWKALTGADTLVGARFVGRVTTTENGEITFVLLNYDVDSNYSGISMTDLGETALKKITVYFDGSVASIPLFSHLEPVEIFDDNSIESKKKNIDNIEAYKSNLEELGVDTSISFQVPIYRKSNLGVEESGFLIYSNLPDVYKPYSGLFLTVDGTSFNIFGISSTGEFIERTDYLANINYSSLTTTSKQIIGAINEINANAVHSDKLVPTLEAITIRTDNTPEDKAANKAVIEAYRDNLTALGVDVTKGFMIPCKFDNRRNGFIMQDVAGDCAGFIKDDNNYFTGGFVLIKSDGTYQTLNLLTAGEYNSLTTTSKYIVKAINEVNALAKGYSTIFTPIELTTETAQNKTAIDARVAAFTAQGISLTNGCCIPVTYKGVYAGNINFINGDWYGLLVKNTNNPADNINIKLSADGTITEGNSAQ